MSTKQTQVSRILAVLGDGEWHSTAEVHSRAGYSRLNSRISDLRRQGNQIEHRHLEGRTGTRAHQYRWLNPTPGLTLPAANLDRPKGPPPLVNDEVPRDTAHRYRIYCVPRYGEQTLIGWAATPEGVGKRLCEMGARGQLDGCVVGVLDTHGVAAEEKPGTWLWNPHEGRW